MGLTGEEALGAARTYTKNSLKGVGALAGAPCQIQSIAPITGGNRVTFLWEDNEGEEHTSTMDVMNGEKGEDGAPGETGLGIKSVAIDANNHLIITYDDDTTEDAGEIDGGGASSLDDLTDIDLTTPQSGDVLVYDGEKWENAVFEGFEREKIYTSVETEHIDGYFVKRQDGTLSADSGCEYCEVAVVAGEKYRVVGAHSYNVALYAFYDSEGAFISAWPTSSSSTVKDAKDITIPNGVAILKCSAYKAGLLGVYKVTESDTYEIKNVHDLLYGKKWFACGDSFTAGAFDTYVDSEGNTGVHSDAYDAINGRWKTYPWWIGQRIGIIFDDVTCADGGIDFTAIEGATRPFSSDSSKKNYTMIPNDCDYITFQFGLNETELTAEQIGTSADTTNDTLWGAYYVVLNYILTANPKVKIGIIISDAWMCGNTTYYEALKEIAEYWGIPYLDLTGGNPEVPMMIGRRGTHSALAENLRSSVFAVSSNNQHPTPEGHKYRSTVIEAFLRTL